jgi:hypothetical protein
MSNAQVKSGQVRSGQVRSGQVRSGQVRGLKKAFYQNETKITEIKPKVI